MTSPTTTGNQFTLRQLFFSFTLLAIAFSLARYSYSYRDIPCLFSFIGFCAVMGGAIGVFWNRVWLGAALGGAGFVGGIFLLGLVGG